MHFWPKHYPSKYYYTSPTDANRDCSNTAYCMWAALSFAWKLKLILRRSSRWQTTKSFDFTLLFCRGRQRNVQSFKMHVLSCFSTIVSLFLPRPRLCWRRGLLISVIFRQEQTRDRKRGNYFYICISDVLLSGWSSLWQCKWEWVCSCHDMLARQEQSISQCALRLL